METPEEATEPHRRSRFDGLGPFVAAAALFYVLALLLLAAAIMSPTSLQWTGKTIKGTERGGIVFYNYKGQTYSLDDPKGTNATGVTVILDPNNPSTAMLDNPVDRLVDVVSVLGPVLLGTAVIGAGYLRRSRRRASLGRRGQGTVEGFGTGLDPQTVSRLLERQNRPGRP